MNQKRSKEPKAFQVQERKGVPQNQGRSMFQSGEGCSKQSERQQDLVLPGTWNARLFWNAFPHRANFVEGE
jgi:hypothetical protein